MEFDNRTPADESQPTSYIPSYMITANNHNTGNLNDDMFGGDEYSPKRTLVNRAYNMVASASLSAVNSFYNTAVWAIGLHPLMRTWEPTINKIDKLLTCLAL